MDALWSKDDCIFVCSISEQPLCFPCRGRAAAHVRECWAGATGSATEGMPTLPQPPSTAPLPPLPFFPQPLPGAASAAFPLVLAPAAAAKISEELLSILILIGPFLIIMFLQQFQPIMVSQGY